MSDANKDNEAIEEAAKELVKSGKASDDAQARDMIRSVGRPGMSKDELVKAAGDAE